MPIQWIYTNAVPKESRTRDKNLMLRMSAEERALLESLSEATGLSMADSLRQALRNEAKRQGLNITSKPNRPRKK